MPCGCLYLAVFFQVEDVSLQKLILHRQQQQFLNNKESADARIITSHWGAFSVEHLKFDVSMVPSQPISPSHKQFPHHTASPIPAPW